MKQDNNHAVFKIHKPKPRYPVINEIRQRFSPRFFASDQVKKEDLNSMLEAARWAPSGHNWQPWFFYIAKKGTEAYTNIFSTLEGYNQSWAHTAPLFILACYRTKNEKGENEYAQYDLGAAVLSLILQGQSLGYYGRQMGLFDKRKMKALMPLEKDMEPKVVIALGKIGDYTNAPKEIMETELDPRPRKTTISQEL